MYIQIKSDLDELKSSLDGMEKSMPKLTRRVLGAAGTGIKKTTKKNFSNYFNNRTGMFFKSLKYKVRKSGNSVIISASATSDGTSKGIRYPFVLAAGATILPKNGKTLTFLGKEGVWKRVKQTVIKPTPWIETPAESYLASSDYQNDIDAVLQKHIDTYLKKE